MKPTSAVSTLLKDQNLPPNPVSPAPGPLNSEITPAPREFGGNERKYRQIWRERDIAVLEARIPDGPITSYEVVIIRVQSPYERFGKSYPAKELYPSNEAWGILGWSFDRNHQSLAIRAAETILDIPAKERRLTIRDIFKRSGTKRIKA